MSISENAANDLYEALRLVFDAATSVSDRGDGTAVVHVAGWPSAIIYRSAEALAILRVVGAKGAEGTGVCAALEEARVREEAPRE